MCRRAAGENLCFWSLVDRPKALAYKLCHVRDAAKYTRATVKHILLACVYIEKQCKSCTVEMGKRVVCEARLSLLDVWQRVLNTIEEARAPSTRRLYALKWKVFSAWCTAKNESPDTCSILVILAFLQDQQDVGSSPSTLYM